ncbi:MAG: hypothetical protein R2774_04650 [Saprospiraceae bacterium]
MTSNPRLANIFSPELNCDTSYIPEFAKKRILVITYFKLGYDIAYITKMINCKASFCENIIEVYTKNGINALMKKNLDFKMNKQHSKLKSEDVQLLSTIVNLKPPQNSSKWTYALLTSVINHSGLFNKSICLATVRKTILLNNIDIEAWKSRSYELNDQNLVQIRNTINQLNDIKLYENKNFELDIELIKTIIQKIKDANSSITILNVFLEYKKHHSNTKLTIFVFSKLLKNSFPNWQEIKAQIPRRHGQSFKKVIIISENEVTELNRIINSLEYNSLIHMRAKICLEMAHGFNANLIAETLGCSKSMVYTVYDLFKKKRIQGILYLKTRNSSAQNQNIRIITKYPTILRELQRIIDSNSANHMEPPLTINEITKRLNLIGIKISNTSVSNLLKSNNINYIKSSLN